MIIYVHVMAQTHFFVRSLPHRRALAALLTLLHGPGTFRKDFDPSNMNNIQVESTFETSHM